VTGVLAQVKERFSELEQTIDVGQMANLAGQIMLQTIDEMWTEHLDNLERVDDAVGLRGYGQLDPLLEFKKEAHTLFVAMVTVIRMQVVSKILFIQRSATPMSVPSGAIQRSDVSADGIHGGVRSDSNKIRRTRR
jgi:preprotein translocase subunit SecA